MSVSNSGGQSQPQQQEAIEFCIGDVVSLPPATSRSNNTYATTAYTGTIGKIVGPVCSDPCDLQQTPICLVKVLGEASHSPLVFAVNELQPLTEAEAFQELLKSWGYRDITALINRVEDQLHQQYQTERREYYCVLQTPEGGPAYCVSRWRLFIELDKARRGGQRYEQCPAPDPEQNLWMVVGNFTVEEEEGDDDEDVLLPPVNIAEQQQQAETWQPADMSEEKEEAMSRVRAELTLRDYDAQRTAERDMIALRWQVWGGSIALVSLLSMAGYALGVCPWLFAFMARLISGNEEALKIIRKFLRSIEQRYGYQEGYEHFYDSFERTAQGGARVGLRNTFLVLQTAVIVLLLIHVWGDVQQQWPIVVGTVAMSPHLFQWAATIVIVLVEGTAMLATARWLREPKKLVKKVEEAQ